MLRLLLLLLFAADDDTAVEVTDDKNNDYDDDEIHCLIFYVNSNDGNCEKKFDVPIKSNTLILSNFFKKKRNDHI